MSAYRSPDGLHWHNAGENPILGISSGGPIGFYRAEDGRYIMYMRPSKPDRRIARSESWDFIHWTEPKIVIDQDPVDPVQVQMYGMDTAPYGGFELGLLTLYETVKDDMDFGKPKGMMVPELLYSRTGYAWHRIAPGSKWIELGKEGEWDAATISPSSLPCYLEDEIRWYYCGTNSSHEFVKRGIQVVWGLGFVSAKPDRFVSLNAADAEAKMLTRPFWSAAGEFYLNADIADGGQLAVEVADTAGKPIDGFAFADFKAIKGDSLRHKLTWTGDASKLANQQIRFRIKATNAKLYSISGGTEKQAKEYWNFRIPGYLPMQEEKMLLGL